MLLNGLKVTLKSSFPKFLQVCFLKLNFLNSQVSVYTESLFSMSMSEFIFYLIKNTIFLNLSAAQLSSQAALFDILSDMRTAVQRERYHKLVPHFNK